VVGQHDILTTAGLDESMANSLQMKATVDTLASGMDGIVPTCADKVYSNKRTLDEHFDKAITAFSA
jgi:hypothetical protein